MADPWYNNANTRGWGNVNYYDDAQEYNPLFDPNKNPNYGKSFAGVGRFDPRNMIRPSNLTQDLGASTYQAPPVYPGQRNIHEGFGTADVSSSFEPPEKKSMFSGLTTPITAGIGWLKDKMKRPPQMQEAYESIMGSVNPDTGRGTYKGNEYQIKDGKIYSELYPHGKFFDSFFGSKSIEEMEDKGWGSIGWAQDRLQKGKKISQRLHGILKRRGIDEKGNWIDSPTGGAQFGDTTTGDGAGAGAVTTGGGGTFNPMLDERGRRNRGESAAPSWHGATASRQAAGKQVAGPGFGQGAYWADGGRVGYQDGELVEDDYMAEATPQGMMEENIEEVQGEPSREQLEAIALEIFQLPLEELNEQQLEVVYQAAMEQEPSEEEVQFAAQEGPGEGIASLV